jgi:Sensors of blue-light using FAD
MLYRMSYCSLSQRPVTDAVVRSLLMTSRFNNQRDGITGMLLADGHRFIQVLEGPQDAVCALYERIAHDARHRCVVELMRQNQVAQRWCANWSLGYIALSELEFTGVVTHLMANVDAIAGATWARSAAVLKAVWDADPANAPSAKRA